ncbi:MAG TPA: hypothetical protein VGF55_09040 [Gemmataceae bacterium]|jgi:hypothetical protein
MIPELVDGVLPEGVHDCTFAEVSEAFGRFWRTDQRIRLTERLRDFLDAARLSGVAAAVVIDGSYVTAKEVPNDIDVLVAVRTDVDLTVPPPPFVYNILSKRAIRRTYGFDAFVLQDAGEDYRKWVEFFSRVRSDDPDQPTARSRKGLLRVVL